MRAQQRPPARLGGRSGGRSHCRLRLRRLPLQPSLLSLHAGRLLLQLGGLLLCSLRLRGGCLGLGRRLSCCLEVARCCSCFLGGLQLGDASPAGQQPNTN